MYRMKMLRRCGNRVWLRCFSPDPRWMRSSALSAMRCLPRVNDFPGMNASPNRSHRAGGENARCRRRDLPAVPRGAGQPVRLLGAASRGLAAVCRPVTPVARPARCWAPSRFGRIMAYHHRIRLYRLKPSPVKPVCASRRISAEQPVRLWRKSRPFLAIGSHLPDRQPTPVGGGRKGVFA